MTVSGARKLFDAEGNLADDATREKLKAFLEGFVAESLAALTAGQPLAELAAAAGLEVKEQSGLSRQAPADVDRDLFDAVFADAGFPAHG